MKVIEPGVFEGTGWYKNQPYDVLYLDNCLLGYKMIKPSGDYTITEGTRVLANQAFSDCKSITLITIPNSVISISYAAFSV